MSQLNQSVWIESFIYISLILVLPSLQRCCLRIWPKHSLLKSSIIVLPTFWYRLCEYAALKCCLHRFGEKKPRRKWEGDFNILYLIACSMLQCSWVKLVCFTLLLAVITVIFSTIIKLTCCPNHCNYFSLHASCHSSYTSRYSVFCIKIQNQTITVTWVRVTLLL